MTASNRPKFCFVCGPDPVWLQVSSGPSSLDCANLLSVIFGKHKKREQLTSRILKPDPYAFPDMPTWRIVLLNQALHDETKRLLPGCQEAKRLRFAAL